MNRIAVIDLGTGNLRSVARALAAVTDSACEVRVTTEAGAVAAAERVVFPGQGAIASCMERLNADSSLRRALLDAIAAKPFLGICIGLQALYTRSSEDGGVACLDVLQGECRHFTEAFGGEPLREPGTGRKLKVPHMGWNRVRRTREHPLWQGIGPDAWFYFVHSYCALPGAEAEVYGTTCHGLEFAAAAARENVFAVQFHPEKSQRDGLRMLANFVHWDGN